MRALRLSISLVLAVLSAAVCRGAASVPNDIAGAEAGAADTVKWYDRVQRLDGLTVTATRKRYVRKNNSAVELMRKVIAARRKFDISSSDYRSFDKYQKITLASNDISPRDLASGILSEIPDVYSRVEFCPYNQKLILPVMMTETATHTIAAAHPKRQREIVTGERAEGVNNMFQSGDLLVVALKDFFSDVNVCDNRIRLLQQHFVSPVADDAISFYRYYIIDTLSVGANRCIHLSFFPDNSRDVGFCGDIYVLADSTYRLKRCEMSVPVQSELNFIDGMYIGQEFDMLPDGRPALVADNMLIELKLFDFMQKAVVIRNTTISGYAFDAIPDERFSLYEKAQTEREARQRDDSFWLHRRSDALSRGEQTLHELVSGMGSSGNKKLLMTLLKIVVENYVEAGTKAHPGKFDIGPVTSTLSTNAVDGLRLRIGGQTNARLCSRFFLNGYYAHGMKSHEHYYKAEATWSMNEKKYLPREFPMRNITFTSVRDVQLPSDRFLSIEKDNVFASLKWTNADAMMCSNSQQLKAEREELFGLRTTLSLKTEKIEPRGTLVFGSMYGVVPRNTCADGLRTTEMRAELRYAPGEKFVSTKQMRRKINFDAPVLTLSHALGVKGVLGSDCRYNLTELSLFRRFHMSSWGKVDISVAAAAQWNQVPYPLLLMPASNLSYVSQTGMFSLLSNMEFLSDRSLSAHLSWDINGKLFNRLPLLCRLKWREYIAVKVLWAELTDKNNPMLPCNARSSLLMPLPSWSSAARADRPYVEMALGIHNIFRFLHVEYVRRLTCLDMPAATRHGVRFRASVKF